jgi:hypothetical protein
MKYRGVRLHSRRQFGISGSFMADRRRTESWVGMCECFVVNIYQCNNGQTRSTKMQCQL